MPGQRFGSVRLKFLLYFGVSFLALFGIIELVRYYGIPFVGMRGVLRTTTEEVFRHFSVLADLQEQRIVDWLDQRKTNMNILSQAPSLRAALRAVSGSMGASANASGGDASAGRWSGDDRALLELRQNLLFRKKTIELYSDLDVLDAQNGTVVVSTRQNEEGVTRFQKGILKKGNDGKGFFLYAWPDPARPGNGFLSIGVFLDKEHLELQEGDGGGLLLVAHLDLRGILLPLLLASKGLGTSGEVVLVNQDRLLLLPLKHPLSDGSTAVPFQHTLSAVPAVRAAGGYEGVIEERDYRGIPVLATMRFIPISPSGGWGMVIKQDRQEALLAARKRRTISVLLYGAGLPVILLWLSFLVNYLTRPLREMKDVAMRVESGDFSRRIPFSGNDELGVLAAAFNKMIDRIQGWKDELEKQVEGRTAELNAANQQLRASEQQLQASNQQLRANQQQLRAMNQQLVANDQRLHAELTERKKLEEVTQNHLRELQIFIKSSVGREERIVELKKKIRDLEEQLHRKDRQEKA